MNQPMKSFDINPVSLFEQVFEALGQGGPGPSALQSHLFDLQDRLREADRGGDLKLRADIELQIARTLVELGRGAEAWAIGRRAFEVFMTAEDFESAADVCDVLFQSEQPGSLCALGQGIWLAVTYPVDPELTVDLLTHVVDETPADTEASAVAAIAALYLVDLRAEGQQREQLMFFVTQILSQVARRHSGVDSQDSFDAWMERLGLRDPNQFLARLRLLVEALVQGDWWFDRTALQAALPA
jgi:hypothetical protein